MVDRYLEKTFPPFLAQHGLPHPVPEHEFHPTRNWRLDWAWPGHKVALEMEGGIYGYTDNKGRKRSRGAHSSVQGILRDIEKYNAAVLEGWRVLRVEPSKLTTQATVDMLRRLLQD